MIVYTDLSRSKYCNITQGIIKGREYETSHSDYDEYHRTIKLKYDTININVGKTGCPHLGGNKWKIKE